MNFKKIPEGILYGGLAQLGEHLPCKQGVESSNLLVSICEWNIRKTEINILKKISYRLLQDDHVRNFLRAYSSAG